MDRKMDISQEITNPGAGDRLSKILRVLDNFESYDSQDHNITEFPDIQGYTIIEKIGTCTDADVYLAYHNNLKIDVAIKYYKSWSWDAVRCEKANQNCQYLEDNASLLPCIPTHREHGWLGDRLWLACDFITCLPLYIYCNENDLNLRGKVEFLISLCFAVQSLHDAGIHHCNLTTNNILVTDKSHNKSTDKVKLIDLNLAATIFDPTDTTLIEKAPINNLTDLSPEQTAVNAGEFSVSSNVYDIGTVAYIILSGGHAPLGYESDIKVCVDNVINEPVCDITKINPAIPKDLSLIINRALSQVQKDKYPSAVHLAEDLQCWLSGKPVDWTKTSWWRKLKWAIRKTP